MAQAIVDAYADGQVSVLAISGLIDEHFAGFGTLSDCKALVLDVSQMSRMTSFGVRQWRKAIDALPRGLDVYLVGCPTFFVDQLNMVLNFGGPAKTLSVAAPYTCAGCSTESSEMVDVLADRASLGNGTAPEKTCTKCGGKLELDEAPESYFSFIGKYGASTVQPEAARVLAQRNLYHLQSTASADKPPRVIKLVHGSVTYFRVIGNISEQFRARPLLVGAEGEVVIDLAEVERIDPAGLPEWKRLLKTLSTQVPAVTLVDVGETFLAVAGETLTLARNIAVASMLVPYRCTECNRASHETFQLQNITWPLHFAAHVCTTCGGTTTSQASGLLLAPLQKASTSVAEASAKLVAHRDEVLSRAMTDANVARAGEQATVSLRADDTVLGKYKIVRPLSAGGMAEVFVAKQIGIGGFEKPVALKRIQRSMLQTRHVAIDMFLNEAKIAGRLMHPNIVQVLDVGEEAGALFLAMEYVRGRDVRDVVKKLRVSRLTMPLGEACYIIREIAQALHHAYWSTDLEGKRLNVVHRDVSPHNVMLGFDGSVKLLDFGVALSAVTEQGQKLIVGKWLYMAPEAATSQPIDHRSDLFSLGVIAYLLFSSALPFTGTDPKEIVPKIRAGNYKPLEDAVPDLPPALTKLVARMLSADPADRPQTGHEVVAALNDIARSNGIESTASDISALLANLFPEEQSEMAPAVEIVRVRSADTMPGSNSPTSALIPDVSVTISPRSLRASTQPGSGSMTPRPLRTSTPPFVEIVRDKVTAKTPPPQAPSTSRLILQVIAIVVVLAAVGYFVLHGV